MSARIRVDRVRDGSHTAFQVDIPAPFGASIRHAYCVRGGAKTLRMVKFPR